MDNTSKSKIIRFGVSFPEDILEELDSTRKDVPRSRYFLRLFENQKGLLKT